MLNPKEILKLFNEFNGSDRINLYGLILEPLGVENIYGGNRVEFNVYNPNNVTFCSHVILYLLDELLEEFERYVDIHLYATLKNDDTIPEIYIDKELYKRIDSFFKSVKTLNINDKFVKMEIKGESKGFEVNYEEENKIIFRNKFVPLSGKIIYPDNDRIITDLDDVITSYKDYLDYSSNGFESDTIYFELDAFWHDYPLLGESYNAFYYKTKFL